MPCLRKALLIRRQPQSPLPVWKSKSTKLETARTIVDGRTTGFCKLIADRSTGGILGCHVVGGRAVEIVQVVAIAMAGELRVDQLAQIPLSFPTFMPASSRERHTALLNRSTRVQRPAARWRMKGYRDSSRGLTCCLVAGQFCSYMRGCASEDGAIALHREERQTRKND